MSVIEEIVTLEGIDCENTPPCEIMFTEDMSRCGVPSAFRIHTRCTCGDSRIIFVCDPHMKMVNSGQAQCGFCWQARYATSVL